MSDGFIPEINRDEYMEGYRAYVFGHKRNADESESYQLGFTQAGLDHTVLRSAGVVQ